MYVLTYGTIDRYLDYKVLFFLYENSLPFERLIHLRIILIHNEYLWYHFYPLEVKLKADKMILNFKFYSTYIVLCNSKPILLHNTKQDNLRYYSCEQ